MFGARTNDQSNAAVPWFFKYVLSPIHFFLLHYCQNIHEHVCTTHTNAHRSLRIARSTFSFSFSFLCFQSTFIAYLYIYPVFCILLFFFSFFGAFIPEKPGLICLLPTPGASNWYFSTNDKVYSSRRFRTLYAASDHLTLVCVEMRRYILYVQICPQHKCLPPHLSLPFTHLCVRRSKSRETIISAFHKRRSWIYLQSMTVFHERMLTILRTLKEINK